MLPGHGIIHDARPFVAHMMRQENFFFAVSASPTGGMPIRNITVSPAGNGNVKKR
jgi:hypothetical protein